MTAHEVAEVLPFQSKLTAAFVTVTPEMAERWLSRNARNRHLRRPVVSRYSRDMAAGRWHLAGDPIRFGGDGALLDGQHRLSAIVETGVTLNLLVVRGVAAEAQAVMDTGRARTAGDALNLRGERNYSLLAAAAKFAIQVDAGRIQENLGGGGFEISHQEILDFVEANPDLRTACDFIKPLAKKTDCRPTIVIYAYFVMRRISEQGAAEFWVGVAEKAGLAKNDPILVLANRFAEARRNNESLPIRVLLSMIYRAWNAKREGREIARLPIYTDKQNRVIVPIPKPH